MKKTLPVLGILAALVVGVLAALQIDRWLNRPRVTMTTANGQPTPVLTPVAFEQGRPIDFREAARRLIPAVVSVDTSREAWNLRTDEILLVPQGSGSGVIIDREGYILTNNHVVEGAAQVQVRLNDQRTFEAQVVGTDPRSDLAVLRIQAPNLTAAQLGTSGDLEIGEWVIAVGNPLGYANTVSVGVVSSLKRTLPAERGAILIDAIQTDAAINSGNSGGALANALGHVVGINTAIITTDRGGGNIGIGFAIPVDRAKRVVQDIIRDGRVRYGSAGIDIFPSPNLLQNPDARRSIQEVAGAAPPNEGLIVRGVSPGGPAAQAGIRQFDVLVQADGVPLRDLFDLIKLMADKRAGDTLNLQVWSRGQTRNVQVRLQEMRGL
jgi:S1-C subfamily serine protease